MGCASCRAFWAVGIPERFCTLVAKLVLYGDRYAGSIAIASLRDFLAGTPSFCSHSSVSVVQAALGADMHHLALQDWQGLVFGRFWLEILGFVGWDRENRSALFSYPPPPNVSLWSTCRTKGIRTDEFDSR